ncbi:MAG: hypothetical protein K0U29_05830 [Gammaproteobacteria bacterium]|nr:hypothetical protein [Gammaproteobacteria bacterium]
MSREIKRKQREALWQSILKIMVEAAKSSDSRNIIMPFIKNLLSQDPQGFVELAVEAANDPTSNRYKVLYGLTHSRQMIKFKTCISAAQRNRIFTALEAVPTELTSQTSLSALKPPDPSDLAFRLSKLPPDDALWHETYAETKWNRLSRFIPGYKPMILDPEYFEQRHPVAVRSQPMQSFDIYAGHFIDEMANHISFLIRPIEKLGEGASFLDVFREMRQIYHAKRDITDKQGVYDLFHLTQWYKAVAISSEFHGGNISEEEARKRLSLYYREASEKLYRYSDIAAKQHHNFLAISRLAEIHKDKINFNETNANATVLRGHNAVQIQLMIEQSELAKKYHGSIGYALAAECHLHIAVAFETAYKRSNKQNSCYRHRWENSLANAYRHMKIAVALQPKDRDLFNHATQGYGFKMSTLAIQEDNPEIWQKRLKFFRHLLRAKKCLLEKIDQEVDSLTEKHNRPSSGACGFTMPRRSASY